MKDQPIRHARFSAPLMSLCGLFVVLAALLGPQQVVACDACNLSFAKQLTGERAESVIARDQKRAMRNQESLNLDGYSSPALMQAQMNMIQEGDMDSSPSGDTCTGGPDCAMCTATTAGPAFKNQAIGERQACDRNLTNPKLLLAEYTPSQEGTVMLSPPRNSGAGNPSPIQETERSEMITRDFATREFPEYMREADFIEILERDYALSTTPYSTVPQDAPVDKKFTIRMSEGKTYIGNGVVYDGFMMNDKIPGPTIVVDEGDIVELEFINEGTIPHGASIHAAYTQTSKYVGKLGVGETKSIVFRAMMPGVYMYHCAPGGHAIGMHVIGGQ